MKLKNISSALLRHLIVKKIYIMLIPGKWENIAI